MRRLLEESWAAFQHKKRHRQWRDTELDQLARWLTTERRLDHFGQRFRLQFCSPLGHVTLGLRRESATVSENGG